MAFICERCGHDAKTKQNLVTHLRKQRACDTTSSKREREVIITELSTPPERNNRFECEYCKKKYSTSVGKCKHKKICPQHPDRIVAYLSKELQELKQKLSESLISTNNAQVTTNNTHEDVEVERSVADDNQSKASSSSSKIIPSVKSKIPHSVRMACWDTHIGFETGKTKCLCCKTNDIFQGAFVCGHVIPESQGGSTTVENLRPICNACNNSMLTTNMKEFAWKYYRVEITSNDDTELL